MFRVQEGPKIRMQKLRGSKCRNWSWSRVSFRSYKSLQNSDDRVSAMQYWTEVNQLCSDWLNESWTRSALMQKEAFLFRYSMRGEFLKAKRQDTYFRGAMKWADRKIDVGEEENVVALTGPKTMRLSNQCPSYEQNCMQASYSSRALFYVFSKARPRKWQNSNDAEASHQRWSL